MAFNQSPLAFDDLKPHFDRALEAEKGIKIVCDSFAQATILRARFNYYRKLDRQANTKVYEADHPLYGKSLYDKLILRVPKKGTVDSHCLYIEKRVPTDWKVEDLE